MAAISLENTTRYGARYHTQRINRRLDDRDNILKEALVNLEDRDTDYYPTIYTAVWDAAWTASDLGNSAYVIFTGVNLSATASDWSVIFYDDGGAKVGVISDASVTGARATFTNSTANDLVVNANRQYLMQIKVGNCVAANIYIPVTS
jgi:hypothetical protein